MYVSCTFSYMAWFNLLCPVCIRIASWGGGLDYSIAWGGIASGGEDKLLRVSMSYKSKVSDTLLLILPKFVGLCLRRRKECALIVLTNIAPPQTLSKKVEQAQRRFVY
jgi:hypothetical protein